MAQNARRGNPNQGALSKELDKQRKGALPEESKLPERVVVRYPFFFAYPD